MVVMMVVMVVVVLVGPAMFGGGYDVGGDGPSVMENSHCECIVRLETEKYDLEERQKRQDYDVSIPLTRIM